MAGAPLTRKESAAHRRLVRELTRIVGRQHISTSAADLALYAYDSSVERHTPQVVVFPAATEEVAAVVRLAHRCGVPFVPRGAGTNLSGGTVPIAGGIVITLTRLNRVLRIDTANRCAVLQPGVTNLALQAALAPRGWVFHPDPASQKVSTIGGNVAENAGGPHCLKYGVTTNHVLGARVVLPDGEVADFGGVALDAPGYDLIGLLNGSEGTLGIATEITVRISPQPEAVGTLLAAFDSMEAASEAVSAIIAAGVIPASLEMMDHVMIMAVQEFMDAGYPRDAEAVLIIEVDGLREALASQARRCEEICRQFGAREVRRAASERERERLWAGRRGSGSAAARLTSASVVNDGVVPRAKLPQVLRQTRDIAARYGLSVANTFHAGDGNLHPQILFDDRDPAQQELAKQASVEILRACIAAGGVISGEHGIGLEKRAAMPLLYSPAELAAHAAVKRAFDPRGLCNPGKILPETVPPVPTSAPRISPGSRALAVPAWLQVEGATPEGLLVPESENEVAALLAGAADEGCAIIPFGSGTKLGLGMPPRRADYALSLGSITGVIEHDAENLTATVRAGTRLADLQRDVAGVGQWLPLDPPHREATIGGIIATNSCGPWRMRHGGCRDLVLGLRVALPSGQVIAVGGKTMKNVSGYDLPKLFVGSLGTLGVITAATFKLLPLPQHTAWSGWRFDDLEQAMGCAHRLASSQLELTADEVLSGALAGRARELVLACRAQGDPAAVERQMKEIAALCDDAGGAPLDGPETDWQRVTTDAIHQPRAGFAVCRIALPPASLLDAMLAALRESAGCVVVASPAVGTAHLALPAEEVRLLRDTCARLGGSLVVEHGPAPVKQGIGDIWGAPSQADSPGVRKAEQVMRALKAEFDPKCVLNPGRFVGGI